MGIIDRVLAQNDLNLGMLAPNNMTGQGGIGELVGTIANFVFIIAGIVAFVYLLYSGFIYLTAGGNADAAKKGQQGIINAVIGLVIIFLAAAIIRAITAALNQNLA